MRNIKYQKISIVNHAIGLDEVERKRASDRVDAINYCLALCGKAEPKDTSCPICHEIFPCKCPSRNKPSEKAEPTLPKCYYCGDTGICSNCGGKSESEVENEKG